MNHITEKDIPRLIADTTKIKTAIEKLHQDQIKLDRDHELYDIEEIIKLIKQLKHDVTSVMVDYYINNNEDIKSRMVVVDQFHMAFTNLSTLFDDIKNIRNSLQESFVPSVSLEHFTIDWGRLNKTIEIIEQHLGEGTRKIIVYNSLESSQN